MEGVPSVSPGQSVLVCVVDDSKWESHIIMKHIMRHMKHMPRNAFKLILKQPHEPQIMRFSWSSYAVHTNLQRLRCFLFASLFNKLLSVLSLQTNQSKFRSLCRRPRVNSVWLIKIEPKCQPEVLIRSEWPESSRAIKKKCAQKQGAHCFLPQDERKRRINQNPSRLEQINHGESNYKTLINHKAFEIHKNIIHRDHQESLPEAAS